MKFYTSVNRYGNEILYRGYNYGRPDNYRVKFSPTFYLPTKEPSKFKSIFGQNLTKKRFTDMRSAGDFSRRYQEVEDFDVYGTTNFIHEFITQKFPNDIEFNKSDINIVNFDIEVASDNGFPLPEDAAYPIISIAVKSSKSDVYQTWGLGDYDPSKSELNLNINGREVALSGSGNGPIDSLINGLREKTGTEIKVSDYHQSAISSGSDAKAAAYIELELDGKTSWGVGINPNTTIASFEAIIVGLSKLNS